jgi:hypothetical protein
MARPREQAGLSEGDDMAKTAKGKSQPITSPAEEDTSGEASREQPTQEEIALRAYHIYLERGGTEGDPVDDWLQAERELSETDN